MAGVDPSVGLYTRALRFFVKKSFNAFQAMGLHVSLNHFYWPIPDTRELGHAFFGRRSRMGGVDLNEAGQLALLERLRAFKDEYSSLPRERIFNGTFESVDAEVLYSIVRAYKPKRVLEVGAGNSTWLTTQALSKNRDEGRPGELVIVEPYPWPTLRAGGARLIEKKIQDVPLSEIDALGENDILFIDTSHVLKMGSDVQHEYLELLPRLAPGVLVHIHDIFLPAEYPESWVRRDRRFWNEQYLLQAFLAFNSAFEVLWGASFLHLTHPGRLGDAFPSYGPGVWPGSFWIRRK